MSAERRIFILALLVVALLAGCQQAAPTEAPATTSAPEPTEEMVEEEPTAEPTEEMVEEEPTPEPTEEVVQEPVEVTIAHGGSVVGVDHPGQYLPFALGWYEEEGLDVTLIPAGGSNQALQLLIAGEADVIQVAPDIVPLARQQGVNLVSIYVPVTRSNARIGVAVDSEYEGIVDLVGQTIGVPSATSSHVDHVRALAGQEGIDADTEIVMVPTGFNPAEAGEAFRRGEVVALAYWSGFFASLENEGFEFRYFMWEPLLEAPGHVVATTEEYLAEHPDVIASIGRSMAKSAVYAFANPEATVQAYWSVFPESKPTDNVEETLQAEVHRLNTQLQDMTVESRADTRWGWNDPDGWQVQLDFMLGAGTLTDQEMTADDVYVNDLVDEYNDFDQAQIEALAEAGFSD